MLNTKKLLVYLLPLFSLTFSGQNISMHFPQFAGESYMFVLFQGDKTIKEEGVIPESGTFILKVPQNIAPYTGMARWLLTNSRNGGGLDMSLQGKDFSISCISDKPTDANILYKGNEETAALNRLYQETGAIFSKYNAMVLAARSYDKNDTLQTIFSAEIKKQEAQYISFQQTLKSNTNYSARFINIVNITQGIGTQLNSSDNKKLLNIAEFITSDLNWDDLFTSGHWSTVISAWADAHLNIINDAPRMRAEFITITRKLRTSDMYTQFAENVTAAIIRQGRDDLIEMLAPIITESGKVTAYHNNLAVYEKGKPGTLAPDLSTNIGSGESKTLTSPEFAGTKWENTLLIFYQTGCSHCDLELKKITEKYAKLLRQKIRIIAVAADKDREIFKKNATSFPWIDTYTDLKGFDGSNFKNYGVRGTPTIFLINKDGKILRRAATVESALH